MSSELTAKLLKIFAEEATDFAETLEKTLEQLQSAPARPEILWPMVDELFRIMHSLKASTAAVNYPNATNFFHLVENLLSAIKDEQLRLGPEIVNFLYQLGPTIKNHLLKMIQEEGDIKDQQTEHYWQKILDFLGEGPGVTKAKYWKIILRPGPQLLTTGTDPLQFFHELEKLGTIVQNHCFTETVPLIDQLKVQQLYLSWEIVCKSTAPQEQIAGIFLFCGEKSNIEILDISGRYTSEGHEKISGDKRVGDILLERGAISEEHLQAASNQQKRLGEILVANHQVSPEALQRALDDQSNARNAAPSTLRVDVQKLDGLLNLVGELVIAESRLRTIAAQIPDVHIKRNFVSKCEETGRIISDLQEKVMNIRMVPVDSIFSQFHRMVRDLAAKQGKNIRLALTGQETELDKNIIELISNPLKHLVRNAIDHGIELPADREAKGKNPQALIHLKAYQRDGAVFLEITDDGNGLNKERIKAKAISSNILKAGEEVSDEFLYNLIFAPGFSTATTITDVSGRGVGMDVVKKTISQLRGVVMIKTAPGQGTTFTIKLPLTLAIIDGLLVSFGGQNFIMPLLSVTEGFRPRRIDLKTIEGRGEFVNIRGMPNTLIRLDELLKMPTTMSEATDGIILNVNVDQHRYSLLVDDIIGKQQVVLKNLDDNFQRVPGFSGATILGDGQIVPILDPDDLVRLYRQVHHADVSKLYQSS